MGPATSGFRGRNVPGEEYATRSQDSPKIDPLPPSGGPGQTAGLSWRGPPLGSRLRWFTDPSTA